MLHYATHSIVKRFRKLEWIGFIIILQLLFNNADNLFAQATLPAYKPVTFQQLSALEKYTYDKKNLALANADATGRWPVKTVYPLKGALLPFNRIVAYYGNLYSASMGILGEVPKEQMLKKLKEEVRKWELADSLTPVIPALHYVAVTAQGSPGKDGKYRYRMPASEIDKIVQWAREINGISFLDIQVGHSTVAAELPALARYLQMPDVHLGIDPEYSMKSGAVPCTEIGTFDASDINDAIEFLSALVKEYKLPPKILVVHRFTRPMVTNYQLIKPTPEVQVVMDMDGFGAKWLKTDSYKAYIFKEPVQFTGFKLFYKYDKNKGVPDLFTAPEILKFTPIPIYIQYQ